jgi:hypothetical protein
MNARWQSWAALAAIGALACTGGPALAQRLPNDPELELAFWSAIKDSKDPADYKAYVETYPNGVFSNLARVRATMAAAPVPPQTRGLAPPPLPEPPAAFEPLNQLFYTLRTVNLRAGPSTESGRLDTIPANTTIEVVARSADRSWYQVRQPNGALGYVAGSLIQAGLAPPPGTGGAPSGPRGQALAAQGLAKCPGANSAAPLYAEYDRSHEALMGDLSRSLADFMSGQGGQWVRGLANNLGVSANTQAMFQGLLQNLQREVGQMRNSSQLRQRIQAAEARDLQELERCTRARALSREEALAVVADREQKLQADQRASEDSKQAIARRRVEYQQAEATAQRNNQATEAQRVQQARVQYDQEAAAASQASDVALVKQRAQLDRSKALLNQA